MRVVPVVVVCVLAACGRYNFDPTSTDDAALPLIDEPPLYTSGTRYRAIVYQGSSASLFSQFYDTELGVPCALEAGNGPGRRCRPEVNATVMYKDAGCTDPVLAFGGSTAMPACGPAPMVAGVFQASMVNIFAVGAEYFGPAYYGTPATCMPFVTSEPVRFFEQGAPIPETAFGLFDEVIERGRQRLGYRRFISPDGASQRSGLTNSTGQFYDTKVEQTCEIQEDEPGSARCLPTLRTTQAFYLDPACTQLGFSVYGPSPRYGVLVDQQLCRRNVRVFELGDAPVSSVGYRLASNGTCSPSGTATPNVPVIAEVPLSDFEHLTLVNEPYDARLALNVWQTADGVRTIDPLAALFDPDRGTRCNAVVEEGSSTLVCAPQWGEVNNRYWTSPGCAEAAWITGKALCRPDSAAVYFLSSMTPRTTCDGSRYRLEVADAPVDTQVWQRDETGVCYESTQRVFTTVRQVPGTELPPLMRVRE